MKTKFVHNVSKGSRFNQIYIPKEMKREFEVGDLVEVKLLKKKTRLFFYNVREISKFKESLIREIFALLPSKIEQAFISGSFLIQSDYNDIDLIVIFNKSLEGEIYSALKKEFGLKFHLLIIPKERFSNLLKICPLTRSMLYHNVSNKKFILPERQVDVKHLQFLLMMPEDLLEIRTGSRVFYDSLRRLIAIEYFLRNKDEDVIKINAGLEALIRKDILISIKNNEEINDKILFKLREIIKIKLKWIRLKLKNG
ncbi:MAG: hypothetical protein NT076_01070 [Candidatus Pacearchaeota archaeon]|nr:hypothetical protein [Candidatus Pacearchaeota archaeon]